jgi:hypothetical protein
MSALGPVAYIDVSGICKLSGVLSSVCLWLYSPLFDPGLFINSLILYTVGRTTWTGDQPVTRPLPTHRTAQTQTHTDIHALRGIRTHNPSVRTSEDSSCLRPLGHCDRGLPPYCYLILTACRLLYIAMFGEVTSSYMYIVLEGNVKGEDRWETLLKRMLK